ncbi:hypothetical protein [Actinomadura sp. 3N407]|uniref:hypothetical protein n=1 Tax=Actinomadura sp. 3N407 TaxID=3457423 RepID=UPI003FCD0E3F
MSLPTSYTFPAVISPDTAEVWAAYFPGLTPLEAYQAACRDRDERAALHAAVSAVAAELPNLTDESGLPGWRARLAAAKTALLRRDGVPTSWISSAGEPMVAAGTCWSCRQPGADHTDHSTGRARGHHTACRAGAQIRCDLLLSVSTRLLWGEEGRARMWERRALATHQQFAAPPEAVAR